MRLLEGKFLKVSLFELNCKTHYNSLLQHPQQELDTLIIIVEISSNSTNLGGFKC